MYLQLDGRGALHAQLTRALKSAVFAGHLGQGERLPATRELARELGVSRNTVLTAYDQLRAEGFVEGRVGSGSYVTPPLRSLAAVPVDDARIDGNRLPPQSAFADRARRQRDGSAMPGRPVPGARYSFQYGVPEANPTLSTAWARELAHAAAYTPPGYPSAQGLPALREAICDYLARRRGLDAAPDDVVVVAGTQQAVALTARVLLDTGDQVVLEEPHYSVMRDQFLIHGARVDALAVDGQGLRVGELPLPAPKLVCVTPSHQFPTGVVMSLARRLELLDYARRHGCWVLEDDYDGEFRYDSRPLAALRSLDEHGRTLYVGTFSKALCPALRLGYLVVPPGLRQDFVNAKWQDDFGSSAIEQAALARFIAGGGFERHLRRSARALHERRAALLQGLRERLEGRLEVADSRAGMHLVAWLRDVEPEPDDPLNGRLLEQLIEAAARRGLGLHSIAPYYLRSPSRPGLLMGYAGLPLADIDPALDLLVECMDEVMPVPAP